MKKFILAVSAFLLFASCSKTSEVWKTDLDAAKKEAQKKNKDIYLLVTSYNEDAGSSAFKQNVIDTEDFIKKYSQEYVLVNINLSNEEFEKAYSSAEPDKNAIKQLETKIALAQTYSINSTPCVYILSKNGFYKDLFMYDPTVVDFTTYEQMTAIHEDQISLMGKYINDVETEKGVKKVQALSELMKNTADRFYMPLKELIYDAQKLDPKNESGVMGELDYYEALFRSLENFNSENPSADFVIDTFTNAASRERMAENIVQQAWYNAAYLIAQKTEDMSKILDCLNKSYNASPESKDAPMILQLAENYERILQDQTAAQEIQQQESAQE